MPDGWFLARRFASGAHAYGSPSPVVIWLLLVATAMMLSLSGNLLALIGVPYLSPGGSVLLKLHPYTYALALAIVLLIPALHFGHYPPLRHPASIFLMTLALVLVVEYIRSSSGLSYIINTLIAAPLAGLVAVNVPNHVRRLCFTLIVVLLALNSSVALFEALTNTHILPFYSPTGRRFNFVAPFRSTALLGHPLANALITSSVAIAVFVGFRSVAMKYGLTALFVASLFAFGARFATGITIILIVLFLFRNAAHFVLEGGRTTLGAIATSMSFILFAPLLLTMMLLYTSVGERILAKLFVDDSVASRIKLFDIFSVLRYDQIMFGMGYDEIVRLLEVLPGVAIVENFWVAILLQFGLLLFIPFLVAMLMFLKWLWDNASPAGKYALFAFVLISSANNSLATKTPAFAIATIVVLCVTAVDVTSPVASGRHQCSAESPETARGARN